jgi:hypothetical protein
MLDDYTELSTLYNQVKGPLYTLSNKETMLLIILPSDLAWLQYNPTHIVLADHIAGFDLDGSNHILNQLHEYAVSKGHRVKVVHHELLLSHIHEKYPMLDLRFNALWQARINLSALKTYHTHPKINYKNFLCSFNGSNQTSRNLLIAIIKRMGWYNPQYVSKNNTFSIDDIDGYVKDFTKDQDVIYRKFFIGSDSKEFFESTNSFGHDRFTHRENIHNLDHKLTQSFINLVGESIGTSYQPFVTEKFTYSVVTRGLFIGFAQPGWHRHLETYYGFRMYRRLFDYQFDDIQNPIERLVSLMCMLSKFANLDAQDWKDLYNIEQDTIEYNYNHYHSGDCLNHLKQFHDQCTIVKKGN